MTDEEVMKLLGSRTPIDRARQVFSSWAARIEQAGQQHKPPSVFEMRKMEFDAVRAIAKELGVEVPE